MQDDAPIGGDRSAEAFAHWMSPKDVRPIGAPIVGERRSGIGAVAVRTEELRPVLTDDRRRRNHESGHDTAGQDEVASEPFHRSTRPSSPVGTLPGGTIPFMRA